MLHLVHRLTKRGIPWAQASEYADQRHPLAKEALLTEMNERPVIIDRAPVLHKEQQQYVDSQIAKRKEINAQIADRSKQRSEWLTEQSRAKPAANSFDAKVSEIITTQMGGAKTE